MKLLIRFKKIIINSGPTYLALEQQSNFKIFFRNIFLLTTLSLLALDAHAARDCSSYGTWVAGTGYTINQFVKYQGRVYQCAHTNKCSDSDQTKYNPLTGSHRSQAWIDQDSCLVASSSSTSSSRSSSSTSTSRSSSSTSISSSTSTSRSSSSSTSTSRSSSSLSTSSSTSTSSSSSSSSSSSVDGPSQTPLFLKAAAKPHIALVMSMDQELSKKAYNDYSNLDGGVLTINDATYRNDFSYYGYFDPNWCYTYDDSGAANSEFFKPETKGTGPSKHICSGGGTNLITTTGAWSGNFLNWVSMTRMDILRKVLYGGKRATDSTTETILERAYVPGDVHAFVKVYGGSDIASFTPFSYVSGTKRSFCNVSTDSTSAAYPVIRTAAPNTDGYYFWASTEGSQCKFGANSAPSAGNEMTAKVKVCVTNKDDNHDLINDFNSNDSCKKYGTTVQKPVGLLQKKGEEGKINFSLTTGSYKAHLKGGILRKAAAPLVDDDNIKHNDSDDEINLDDGTFNYNVYGIIQNVNSFKVANYKSDIRNYTDCSTHSILISTVKSAALNSARTCTDWGNPIAEIYLEMLRYVSGASGPTSGFDVDDTTTVTNVSGVVTINGVPNLTHVSSWTAPWTDWCSKCAAVIISTGSNSFDSDNLASASNVAGLTTGETAVFSKTDDVGVAEYGAAFAGDYFMGGTATGSRNCTSKTVARLSQVLGICPELPALEGSYNVAGLAYHAHTTDLIPTLRGEQELTTYAVDLAESLPEFNIPVNGKIVKFSPACEASPNTDFQSCTLTNAVIKDWVTDASNNVLSGTILLTWEDSTWGNDYDLDAAQELRFCVGAACNPIIDANKIQIISTTPYAAAGNTMHLSYSIYGVRGMWGNFYQGATSVTASGDFYRGTVFLNPTNIISNATFEDGLVTPWAVRPGSQDYTSLSNSGAGVESTKLVFEASSTATVKTLKKPLWLAAKFGGFSDDNNNGQLDATEKWQERRTGVPDNFYSVKNPAILEENLKQIIDDIEAKSGSASAVATASTRLSTDGYVYQAAFNSGDWTGELRGYLPGANGVLPVVPTKTTTSDSDVQDPNKMQITDNGRNIYFYKNGATVEFNWANLTPTMQVILGLPDDGPSTQTAEERVGWIRGSAAKEGTAFRSRTFTPSAASRYRNILGDIVNSSPVYEGVYDFRYSGLTNGGSTYRDFLTAKRARTPLVLVGANDGMVHAFNAKDSASAPDALREVFAYIPSMVLNKLPNLSRPSYGTVANPHQYLVDGNIAVGDVYFGNSWHSVAVGALGAGGKGIYALDLTEYNAGGTQKPKILFEYSHADMGYVMGQIYILPTKEGRWVAIFGNGDFTGTTSKLFMVDLESPTTNTQIIDTGSGTGLSSPAVLLNGLGQFESAYAGDVDGNMWHFYYDGSTLSSYKVFTTQTGQPITAAPTIGYNDILKKYMVYFGTGRYYKIDDNLIGDHPQSFYAVPDMGAGNAATLSKLLLKEMETDYSLATPVRTIPAVTPNWGLGSLDHLGWYINLDHSDHVMNERVTAKALLLQDKLLITTMLPTNIACDVGGKSWFMEVPAVGDKPPPCVVCTPNGTGANKFEDQLFLGATNVSILPPGSGSAGSASSAASSTSSGSSSSAGGEDSTCGKKTNISLIKSGTQGGSLTVNNGQLDACGTGRQSWRQLR